jgi:hypothetical protein
MDYGFWIMENGLWIMDNGFSILGYGLWIMVFGFCAGRCFYVTRHPVVGSKPGFCIFFFDHFYTGNESYGSQQFKIVVLFVILALLSE